MVFKSALASVIRGLRSAVVLIPLVLVVGGAGFVALYTRAELPVIGLPRASGGLIVVAAILLAAAVIGPWRWLTRQVSAPVQSDTKATPAQRVAFGLAVLLLAAAVSVFGQFDGLLRGMHEPGETSAGVNAATSAFTWPGARQDQLEDAVGAWSRFVRPRSDDTGADLCASRTPGGSPDTLVAAPLPHDCNAPITVLAWQLGLDTAVLVPAYAVLLGLLLVWGRRMVCQHASQITGTAGPKAAPAIAGVASKISWALLGAVVADWIENGLTTVLATNAWIAHNSVGPGEYGLFGPVEEPSWWMVLLTVVVIAKWFGLLVVGGYLLGVGILLAQHGGAVDRRWDGVHGVAQTLLAVRVQLLIVAVFGGLMLLHEQVPDVIRRWTDQDSSVVGARGVVAAVLLAVTVWMTGRWMVDNAMSGTLRKGSAIWGRIGAIAVVTLAAIVAPWLFGWSPDWALLIPIVIVAVIWALSWLLRDVDIRAPAKQVEVPSGDAPETVINRWLAQGLGRQPTASEQPRYLEAVLATNPGLVEAGGQVQLPEGTSSLQLPDVSILSDRPDLAREVLPRLLAGAVVAILGLALLRASAGLTLYNQLLDLEREPFLALALVGLGLLLSAGAGFWLLGKRGTPQGLDAMKSSVQRSPAPALLWLLACLVVWWAAIERMTGQTFHDDAQWLGVIGVVAVGLMLLTITVCSLVLLPDRLSAEPAPLFRMLGLRRTPVLSLLTIWAIAVSVLPIHEEFHDVRPVIARPSNPAATGITIQDAFDQWRQRNCIANTTETVGQDKPVVPLILVASSGGGIRAAAWTSQVLDHALGVGSASGASSKQCTPGQPDVEQTPRVNWVFAASGISGGSLGLAAYAARLTEDAALRPPPTSSAGVQTTTSPPPPSWWRERLDKDSLAASLSWMLFVETPWSLLRFHADQDRAEVLEETWERAWQQHGLKAGEGLDQGFFSLQEPPAPNTPTPPVPRPRVPLLLFNGTSVESGCRFNASLLQSSGRQRNEPSAGCLSPRDLEASPETALAATVDLVDFVCPGQQPRLSTAVMLSARFPVISPSGHLKQPDCADAGPQAAATASQDPPPAPETFVVDGGYLENSGADTAIDLWSTLAPLVDQHNQDAKAPAYIVPLFIQIDNGYAEPAGPGAVPRKPQFVTPLLTVNATRDGRQADARQGAQVLFGKPFLIATRTDAGAAARTVQFGDETTRYVRFSLLAHPGAKAPTGWTLSDTSFDDLQQQFERSNPEGQAGTPLARVQRWFTDARLS
jgi:hypothetical protein